MTNGYITLLAGAEYLPGVLTLAQALKNVHKTTHDVIILLDENSVDKDQLALIEAVYDKIIPIQRDKLFSPVGKLVEKLNRAELAVTFTKILLWRLIDYDKLVYLDADVLPLQSLDGLFEYDVKKGQIAASPDVGWPDIFNSGVLVLRPNEDDFQQLIARSESDESTFDGADQGLLNEHFNIGSLGGNWVRLPFLYNVTSSISYQYYPAFTRFFNEIKALHYIGQEKPWQTFDFNQHHLYWWSVFNQFYSEDEQKRLVLAAVKGEAHDLKFSPIKNPWNEPNTAYDPSSESVQTTPVFPWESRHDKAETTRVFNTPATESIKGSTLKKPIGHSRSTPLSHSKPPTSSLKALKDPYVFNELFDPQLSLDRIAKLPAEFANKLELEKLQQQKSKLDTSEE